MACFLVPTFEAVITTVAVKVMEKKEKKADIAPVAIDGGKVESTEMTSSDPANVTAAKIHFSGKLKWLRNLLWGGSALLAFEHVWHGEVVPWFPFLTAAGDPEEAAVMLQEMSTVGVTMAALVTLVWAGMLGVSAIHEKKAAKEDPAEATEA